MLSKDEERFLLFRLDEEPIVLYGVSETELLMTLLSSIVMALGLVVLLSLFGISIFVALGLSVTTLAIIVAIRVRILGSLKIGKPRGYPQHLLWYRIYRFANLLYDFRSEEVPVMYHGEWSVDRRIN